MNLSHPFIIATLYSLPAVALSATGTLFIVHLPKFHSETVDISLGTISLALLISRAFDAFTDPVIGSLSDRIRIPFFRRPLWVLLGGTVTAFLFYWVCATSFIGYFGSTPFSYIALTVLFFLSFTAILIPYESWGLEITRNRRTRDIIVMFREGATLCGAVVAGALPLLFTSLSSSPEEAYEWVGLAGALLLVCSSFAVIACIPYPKEFQAPSAAKEHFGNGFFRSIREALAFRSFRLLLYAFVLTMIAAQIPAALILFFVQDVLKGEDPSQYVLYYFIGAALGFPLWIWSVHRFSKTMLWMLGIGINTLFFFGVFFVPPHALSLFAWCVVGSGLGLGGVIGVPAAIQADVIEEDGDRSGERREGSFIGIWSIVKKLSAAVGVAGTLSLLSLLGYEPTTATEGNAGPHELSQFLEGALRTLYCLVPCVLNLSALYPILLLRKERELSCKG